MDKMINCVDCKHKQDKEHPTRFGTFLLTCTKFKVGVRLDDGCVKGEPIKGSQDKYIIPEKRDTGSVNPSEFFE